jgi:hypothetical protein
MLSAILVGWQQPCKLAFLSQNVQVFDTMEHATYAAYATRAIEQFAEQSRVVVGVFAVSLGVSCVADVAKYCQCFGGGMMI